MTKEELIRALEPFTDELEIMIGHAGRWYEVDNSEYAMRFGGEGCLVLNLGAQILLRTRPRMETFSVDPAPDAAAPTVPSGQVGFVTVRR